MDAEKRITTFKDAQSLVKAFAIRNGWKDIPNIDKFDHLHQELVEMSKHLLYKSEEERIKIVKENQDLFVSEFGDLIFGAIRLANQLGVDVEEAFNKAKEKVLAKYSTPGDENKIVRKGSL